MRMVAFLLPMAVLTASLQTPVEIFNSAVAALASGNYAAAEAGFQEVLRAAPDHVDSLKNLGVIYSRTGREQQSINVNRRALDLSPNNKGVLLNLGLVYMRQRAFGEALGTFQKLLELDPAGQTGRDIHLLFPLCDGYLRQNRSDESRRKLAAFLSAVTPGMASLIQCKIHQVNDRLEEAEQQCRRALALEPGLPGVHLELARVLVAQHNPEAGTEIAVAIRENPSDPEALYDLGVALLQDGRVEEALPYLDHARVLNPDFWGSYYQLGKARLQSNQAEQAVPLLRKAASLNPNSFSLFYELGRALAATGQTEEASRTMQKVRELMAREVDDDVKALYNK